MIGLKHYLFLSAALFSIGVFGLLARRNVLGLLMSVELLLNAVVINFVAFNRFCHPDAFQGQTAALLVVGLAVAESVIGLSLVVAVTRQFKTILIERISLLKG